MSTLTERLRGIIGGSSRSAPEPGVPQPDLPRPEAIESVLGGVWHEAHGRCLVVEHRREASSAYGHQTVGDMGARLRDASAEAALVAGGATGPFVFFDLETTGLSGGAGTYAFLVGCGWFDDDGAFVTRQFMLARAGDERSLLMTVAAELSRAGALVTFNGKSFDAPLIETRYLFHRLDWTGRRLPHLDVLHPARRLWRRESGALDAPSPCSLVSLERQVLGVTRAGDVPGFEIPERYFRFVRSGDAAPLAAVLAHNRLDLLSLGGLTARLLHLLRVGPAAARDAQETLALGRLYARAGMETQALAAYDEAAGKASGRCRVESLRALALALRRARRFDESAAAWGRLVATPGCPRDIAREGNEALAIHHEHRVRDLRMARAFALSSLDETRSGWNEAVRHRVSRIERKIGLA